MKDIYADAHATTAVEPSVLEAMLPFYRTHYGNGQHKNGWKAQQALEVARTEVAQCIHASANDIVFTSGATESITTGMLGLAQLYPNKKHIVTQVTEHAAVLAVVEHLERQGYAVTRLPVDSNGYIDPIQLQNSIRPNTLLVAIMYANNEIGTIQPVEVIGKICKQKNTLFFCDLTQALSWTRPEVTKLNIDMACMSAHKMYGPKGIGALYFNKLKHPIPPLLLGGKQEQGFRSGTANIPGAVGFGKACSLTTQTQNIIQIKNLRDALYQLIVSNLQDITWNGALNNIHPGNLNIRIAGVHNQRLIGSLKNIFLSSTSACSGGSDQPSYVLTSIGLDAKAANECIRIGVGRFNTESEIEIIANQIIRSVNKIRNKKIH